VSHRLTSVLAIIGGVLLLLAVHVSLSLAKRQHALFELILL